MASKDIMGKTYLDIAGAAAELALTSQTIRAYIKSGRLPAVKIGRQWLIEPAHLAELLTPSQPATAPAA